MKLIKHLSLLLLLFGAISTHPSAGTARMIEKALEVAHFKGSAEFGDDVKGLGAYRSAQQSANGTLNTAATMAAVKKATADAFKPKKSVLADVFYKKYPSGRIDNWPEFEFSLHFENPKPFLTINAHKALGRINCIAVSPCGTKMATASNDGTVRICAIENPLLATFLQHKDNTCPADDVKVLTVAWNNGGTKLATGSINEKDGFANIWDVKTGALLHQFIVSKDSIIDPLWNENISWNYNGDKLAIVSDSCRSIRVLNAQTGDELFKRKHGGTIYSITWRPKDNTIAVGTMHPSSGLHFWNANTSKKIYTTSLYNGGPVAWHPQGIGIVGEDSILKVSWYPTGTMFASAEKACSHRSTGSIVHIRDGNPPHKVLRSLKQVFPYKINKMAWHPSGKFLALGSDTCAMHIWDLRSGTKVYSQLVVTAFSWDKTGDILIAGSHTGTIDLINLSHPNDPQYLKQREELIYATLPPEQLMLIKLLDSYAKQRIFHETNLQNIANLTNYPGITAKELARILFTFHPAIRDFLINYFKIKNDDEHLIICQAQAIMFPAAKIEAVDHILHQYSFGAPQVMEKPHETESEGEKLSKAEKTLADEQIPRAKALFKAIKDHDLLHVEENLNPLTINARNYASEDHHHKESEEGNRRTPLHQAIVYATNDQSRYRPIFHRILHYFALYQPDEYHEESIRPNLYATDDAGNTPLMLAIIRGYFYLAHEIALKMDEKRELHDAFLITKTRIVDNQNIKETAYDLALKYPAKDNEDYKQLMQILSKHKR